MRRSYITATVLALGVTVWIGSGWVSGAEKMPEETAAAPEAPAPRVRVRTLEARDHVGRLTLFGRTEADRSVSVRAETTGTVAELVVGKGDAVEEGALLVRLSMDDREARLSEAKARVAQARIAYDAALQLSKREFRSKVKLAEEKALLEAAQATLAAIELDISRTEIHAPFAGVVETLPVEVGDYLSVGTEVAQTLDLDPIVVAVEVAERNLDGIERGESAQVRLIDGREVSGTVRYVSRASTLATRTFRVEVAVPNPGRAVKAGLTTRVYLPTQHVRAHLMSPSVLTLNDAGALGVKAVDDENRVVFYAAKVVADTPEGVWLGGLPDPVRVIVVGQEFVKAGQAVEPVPADEAVQ